MAKIKFTQEEIEAFKDNTYVIRVSDKSVSFSQEFKEKLILESRAGKAHSKILSDLGIDGKMLGAKRTDSLFKRVRKQSDRPERFGRTKPIGRPKKMIFASVEEENQFLKDRMEYLEQENEFLKKLKALGMR